MADLNHDPTEYIRGIQQILIGYSGSNWTPHSGSNWTVLMMIFSPILWSNHISMANKLIGSIMIWEIMGHINI